MSETPTFLRDEDTSVYDINDHPDYSFRPGSCVVRIPSLEESSEDTPLKRAGQVIELSTSGQLLCTWADQSQSIVNPQDLYVIGKRLKFAVPLLLKLIICE